MSEAILKNNFIKIIFNQIKNNLKKLISLFSILIILLFIYLFYISLQKKNTIKLAEQYTEATVQFKQKKISESKLLLENIINKNHKFYSPLALYFIIDNNLEKDELKIIKFFDKILKIRTIDKENLNLIKIKKAIFLFNDGEEGSIIKTLKPVINSDSIWRNIAIKMMADYFLSKDQKTKANEYIQLLNNKISK
jgi:predicted negative regulator of RcsB-dependent stress response